MATAGRRATVRVSSSAIAFTDEGTTANADRTRYQITDTVKRVWDRTAAITVERDTGGGFSVITTGFTLNRLKGTVVFTSPQSVGTVVRVDGSYLPMSIAAEAKAYSWELVGENADAGIFGDTWMKRQQLKRDVRGTIGQFKTVDNYMETQMLAGNTVVLQFYADASTDPEIAIWAVLNTQQLQAVVDGFVEQTVEFEGAQDADGRVVSDDAALAVSALPAGNEQLVTDLGGNSAVLAFYDARNNVGSTGGVVDTWGDTRGVAGFGPQIVGTGGARPAYAANLVTFNGSSHVMATAASSRFDLSPAISVVYIGTIEAGTTNPEFAVSICDSLAYTRELIIGANASEQLVGLFGPPAGEVIENFRDDGGVPVSSSASRRLLLASKSATTALQTRIADSPVTTNTASGSQVAGNNPLTLGQYFVGASSFCPMAVRAILVLNRAFTSGDYAFLRAYASAQHATVVET